jgi:hypothetical protein
MGYLRLRQICLVASDLASVENQIADVLGLEICFRDPGVGKYGLHNALFAMGGTFLEVVSPTRPETAAGRYIDKRKGDGGYMYIVDCDNLEARREHFKAEGVRLVEDLKATEWGITGEGIHLHPRDTGGCLLSVDRHSPNGENMQGSYKWAGPDWQKHDRSQTVARIVGAAIQSPDPADLATRWSHLLQRPLRKGESGMDIQLDESFVHFGPLRDDRGEGLRAVHLKVKDRSAIIANADRAGVPHGADYVDLVGVRFLLV